MNAAQITHIFWKEYRTQRSLWLAVVLLFLVAAVLSVLFLPEPNRPDVGSLLVSGFVTTVFYLLASTSILYSSEKEQQTDVFLRTLPADPWLMLGVKAGWVLFSSLAAIGIFSLSAYLLADSGHVAEGSVQYAAWVLVYVFCCTLVVSLFSRNVLSTIGFSVVFLFLFPILGEILEHYFEPWRERSWIAYFTIVMISLLLTSLELNRRWFRESDWIWRPVIRMGQAMTLPAALELPLEAEDSARVWRRHLWREWQSVRTWCVGIAAFGILLTTWLYQLTNPAEIRGFLFSITLVIIPLLFGVASCRSDQAQERYLFLGHRGASSFRLLLAKHTLWISSCLLLILAFQLFVWPNYLTLSWRHEEEFSAGLRFVPISSGLLSSARVEQLSSSMVPGIQFCAGIALLLYCLGHYFSLLIRQPVLSLAVAFFTSIFVTLLVCLFYALDVPLFVLTVAPAICLLALSFHHGSDWIIGNRTARSWKRLGLWSLLGLWTLISLLAAWRVFEVSFSTVLDFSGLDNIPTYYFIGCVSLLIVTLLQLLLADNFRRNFRVRKVRPQSAGRRWCTLGRFIGTFLLGHNLLLLAGLIVYSQYTSMLAAPMRQTVSSDIAEYDQTDGDPYQKADEKITSAFPLPERILQDTQQLNRNRNELLRMRMYSQWNSWSDVTEEQQTWLEQSQDVLPFFLEADRTGFVQSKIVQGRMYGTRVIFFGGPYGFLINLENGNNLDLILLARLQALKLEHEGNLGEAWKYHLAVVRYARRFADHNFPSARQEVLQWLNTVMFNGDLWRWQARKEQTPELLARAAEDLQYELTQLSPLSEAYERLGGWVLQMVDSLSTLQLIAEDEPLAVLPWERQRLRTLIIAAMRQRVQLAEKIDEGLVTTRDPFAMLDYDGRELYWFQDLHWQDAGFDRAVILARRRSRPSPELLVASSKLPSSDALDTGVVRFPDAARHADTTPLLMVSPKHVFSLIDDSGAETLLDELHFWNHLDEWIGDCAIYSYRAETGAFPSHLGELHDAEDTRELFIPLTERLTVRRAVPPHGSRRPGVNTALSRYRTRFGPDSSACNYTWSHADKWSQPEYNFGDTPDQKPALPLTAPQPEEIQP